jgi:hypothetical protein
LLIITSFFLLADIQQLNEEELSDLPQTLSESGKEKMQKHFFTINSMVFERVKIAGKMLIHLHECIL